MTQKRQTYFFLTAVFLVAVAVAIVLVIPGPANSNGEDDAPEASSSSGNVVIRQGGYEAATIIIVDDFEGQLAGFIGALKEEKGGDAFSNAAAALIESGMPIKGDESSASLKAVKDQLNILYDEYIETATNLMAESLGGVEASETNCAIMTEGSGFFDIEGSGFFDIEGSGFFDIEGSGGVTVADVAHGKRVAAEFAYLDEKYGSQVTIDFERVDISGFNMAEISKQIALKIAEIRRDDPERPIVVNMSFALVPCESVPTIAIYAALIGEFDPGAEEQLAWMRETFRAILDTGILRQDLAGETTFDATMCAVSEEAREVGMCDPNDEKTPPIIFVAASGNGVHVEPPEQRVGEEYPFYPAAFKEVIAISGNEDESDFLTKPPKAIWSNDGLILMPGLWNWVNRELNIDRMEMGTSFAAPRYSYMMALYLTNAPEDIGCGAKGAIPGPVDGNDWLQEPDPPNKNEPPVCP